MSLCIQQVKCPSWKELIKLPYFLRESTSHATSILTVAAYSAFAATTQLSNLSFFDTDSSFWVCDKSVTGHICKDKSLFTGDLVPSIFEVGSSTGILTPTLMGTVTLCVCVFLASGYKWVTVMHEIPISSAQTMTSLPYPRTQ
jgi:hypothetical protein